MTTEALRGWVLVACALTMTFVAVSRGGDAPATRRPVQVSNWAELQAAAMELLPDRPGKPRLVAFVDFECPACRGFARTLDSLFATRTGSVIDTEYLQFPLTYHPNAMRAARFYVCAAPHLDARERFRFAQWLYERRGAVDTDALASLPAFPTLPALEALERCSSDPATDARIAHHVSLAETAGLQGTPTVIVDGWRFPDVPGAQALDSALLASTR